MDEKIKNLENEIRLLKKKIAKAKTKSMNQNIRDRLFVSRENYKTKLFELEDELRELKLQELENKPS